MLSLAFQGMGVAIDGDWPEVLDALDADFSWFRKPEVAATLHVDVECGKPDFDRFAGAQLRFVTPRNVVYEHGRLTIVDYFGRAVGVLDREAGHLLVRGEDRHLVHEAAYLFVLSRVGEHLDARRLPRLHAAALSGPGGAVAIMLPSGGGKTNLTLCALRETKATLLSEDTPLVDRRGWLHPFPLRLGVNPSDAHLLPDGAPVHRIERMEFHPKLLMPIEALADRIAVAPTPLRHLVIGERSLDREAQLERVPRSRALGPLLREGVVGIGVYQGMEFVLQRGLRDVTAKTGVAATRARCLGAALARATVWRLRTGRDPELAWRALEPLLAGNGRP